MQQEIATIFATHGDRLTVTTSGGSGQVELVVDGEGPEFSAVTPVDNSVTRGSRLTFSFEVRDDDSGLRHDGESVISNDGDYEEINPDGDQHLSSEPLSEDPGTAVPANGAAEDIDVNVAVNARWDGTEHLTAYDDISASGTWRIAGSRAGVAYAFTASGADKGDDEYLYQVEATDRAGNTEMTDAETDSIDSAEPYVFRVDDTEPDLFGPSGPASPTTLRRTRRRWTAPTSRWIFSGRRDRRGRPRRRGHGQHHGCRPHHRRRHPPEQGAVINRNQRRVRHGGDYRPPPCTLDNDRKRAGDSGVGRRMTALSDARATTDGDTRAH